MGAEALVEVHTLGELENALSNAAPVLIINMWDRLSGKHFADMVTYFIYD
jgi:indole-3-glycerol phosphate synthase